MNSVEDSPYINIFAFFITVIIVISGVRYLIKAISASPYQEETMLEKRKSNLDCSSFISKYEKDTSVFSEEKWQNYMIENFIHTGINWNLELTYSGKNYTTDPGLFRKIFMSEATYIFKFSCGNHEILSYIPYQIVQNKKLNFLDFKKQYNVKGVLIDGLDPIYLKIKSINNIEINQ